MHSSCKETALVFRGSITLVVNRRRSPRSRFPRTFVQTFQRFISIDTREWISNSTIFPRANGGNEDLRFCSLSIGKIRLMEIEIARIFYFIHLARMFQSHYTRQQSIFLEIKRKKRQYSPNISLHSDGMDFVQETFFRNKLETMIIPGQRR